MINGNAETARQELLGQGWTLIPDEDRASPTIRGKVTKGLNGQYFSHYDSELGGVVVMLHAKLREMLGLT